MSDSRRGERGGARLLEWGSGGWVLAVAAVLAGVVGGRLLMPVLREGGSRAVGDGKHVETYGFDLSDCRVRRDLIVAAGIPRDGLPVLNAPPMMSAAEADGVRGYLVPGDRVVGVAIGGMARAYPLRVLYWHEVVNDTVGEIPVAATCSGLCDSVAVYDRRVGGRVVRFGVSGLLYNSNLLMYEQGAGEAASLWSQLGGVAVAGPLAGTRLRALPCAVVRWDVWRSWYPESLVIRPDPVRLKRYRREPYASYSGSPQLRFPVAPLPDDEQAWKEPCVGVWAGESGPVVFRVRDLVACAGGSGACVVRVGGRGMRFAVSAEPVAAGVRPEEIPEGWAVAYGYWFAWYAVRGVERAAEPVVSRR